MKAAEHFRTITKHKIIVMKECFRVGLYRQGLLVLSSAPPGKGLEPLALQAFSFV